MKDVQYSRSFGGSGLGNGARMVGMVRMYGEDGSADIEALVIKSRRKNRWKESGASTTEQCQGNEPERDLCESCW